MASVDAPKGRATATNTTVVAIVWFVVLCCKQVVNTTNKRETIDAAMNI